MPPFNRFDLLKHAVSSGQLTVTNDGKISAKPDGSSILLRQLQQYGYNVNDPGKLPPAETEVVFTVAMTQKLEAAWVAKGAAKSPMGLPIGDAVQAHRGSDGNSWVADFRSGTITISGDNIVYKQENVMVVEFVGMECVVRQEKSDEMYGVIAAIGPANAHYTPLAFPGGGNTISMGQDGERIWTAGGPAFELYRGPLENLSIVCTLIEQDSGDVSAISKDIADKINSTAASLVGGLTGVPADAIADQTWFKNGLASGIGLVLGGVLGMGDDPYDVSNLPIYWAQLGPDYNPPHQPAVKRSDDPKEIQTWTHKVVMTGRDDGGDVGTYILYLFVRTDIEVVVSRVP